MDGKKTPPMQSLARDYVKIKMDRAEVESKAGGGSTTMVHKTMQKYAEEKKAGNEETKSLEDKVEPVNDSTEPDSKEESTEESKTPSVSESK